MPDKLDECVQSVLEDNPEYSESRAYAICNAMQNKGQLSVDADASHTELLHALAEAEIDCPEGKVSIGDKCVPIEEVEDVNPGALKNSASVLQLGSLEREPIERDELGDNKVAYRNLKILQAGVWRDSSSKTAIWYSPRGLSNMELTDDNSVNIMHDSENEVSEAGHMENLREEDGSLYADVIIDTSNAAGAYADENMQKTLETEGKKGFGGPSIEIPPEAQGGHKTTYNAEKGVKELVEGKVNGLGFVRNPASKPTGFNRQAATREVALSESDQTVMQLESESGDMASDNKGKILEAIATRELAVEDIEDDAQAIADELDVPIDEVLEVLDPLMDVGEEEDGEEMEDGEEEDEEGEDPPEEEETEMEGEDMQVIQEQIDDLWGEIEELKESMMSESELSEELESAKSDLADAESVAELEEAKEELDKRLSNLEEEPDNNRSLADGAEVGEPDTDSAPVKLAAEFDESSGTIRR